MSTQRPSLRGPLRLFSLLGLAFMTACANAPLSPSSSLAMRPHHGSSVAATGAHYKVGKPYKVKGRTYVPRANPNYDKRGLASWYGAQFHGKKTANGEVFDKARLSAAHKTLPLPSLVEVENLENGRRLIVRVNDRGPFVDDRLIDLSEAAARVLGFEKKGLARVRVRYRGPAILAALAPKPGASAPPVPKTRDINLVHAPGHAPGQSDTRASQAPQSSPYEADAIASLASSATGSVSQDHPTAASDGEFWLILQESHDVSELERRAAAAAALRQAPADMGIFEQQLQGDGIAGFTLRLGPFISASDADRALLQASTLGFNDAAVLFLPHGG